MFNSVFGIITAKLPQKLYLENNGVEWNINVPDIILDNLPLVGEKTKVYTWLYHREDSMRIFGFANGKDRVFFLDLMKVNGIGPNAALKIMSTIPTDQLISILDEEDISKLEKLPGVGKKTAQKMILTLRGKLSVDNSDSSSSKNNIIGLSAKVEPWSDVIAALVSMGYEKNICQDVVKKLVPILEKKESFITKNKAAKEDILFRHAIVELA
ncbi:MAG TPA: Holliday junction branch migration protein RuvA [Treponemataceae bacterium]|nr:Holliday junction branch migration protein RuvA [Treponemataceae bacterium]